MTADIPIHTPVANASFGQSVSRFFSKYGTFSGRATRAEFWWVVLFFFLIHVVFLIVAAVTIGVAGAWSEFGSAGSVEAEYAAVPGLAIISALWLIWLLATIIPWLALSARRLHDVDMSAWWLLLFLVGLGTAFVLSIAVVPPNPNGIRFDR